MPITRSYSLPEEVVRDIDALPKRERSKFVSSTLLSAVRKKSKQNALNMISSITPVDTEDGRSSVELVQKSRERRRKELLANMTGHEK